MDIIMSAFLVLFMLTFALVSGTSNRTFSSFLFDITKETMDLFPSLRKMSRSDDEQKENVAATALKRLNNFFGNIKLAKI
ncbi:hypothetical protein NPIL_4531 [Nephila pilipes]|uniref:Uncharacterized protein n=1 Tax=Nephila pilipes TaxID=299642 RepID=A0A8X6ML59_NEPPI|nr:hypothetical protein NPIL_4531 [Nephila pilipes]